MEYGSWKSKMEFPSLSSVIFLDIETDLETTRVWLIGSKYNQEEQQFIAKNFSQEGMILTKFANYLAERPNLPLVCYSTTNFDFRVLWSAATRLGIDTLHDAMRDRPLVDLGTLLRRHFSPFGNSYSLKMIRFLVGYKYSNEEIFGDDIAIQYYRLVKRHGKIPRDFENLAKSYNLDDVRILHHLISKFSNNINFSRSFVCDIDPTELSERIQDRIYTYRISPNFIRISCKHEDASFIRNHIMNFGCPLPEERTGVNVTALYWKSQFSYHRALEACHQIGLTPSGS